MNFDKDEIKDGDFVEMRFNQDAKNGCYWEPLRIRSDKSDPQFFTIANNVWNTIQEPITKDMIQGNYEIDELPLTKKAPKKFTKKLTELQKNILICKSFELNLKEIKLILKNYFKETEINQNHKEMFN